MNRNLLIVLAFLLFNIMGYGQKTWTGAASNEWDEDLNWAPIGKPTYFDDVIITNATNQPVISSLGIACASLQLKNSTPGSSVVLTIESGDFSSGSITMTSTGGDTSDCSLNIDSGAVIVTGNVTMGAALQNDVTFSGAGSLSIGGTITGGALNAGKGTVDYNGTATHTVGPYIYNNLTFSGSGIRTISSGVTVNGTLVMAGSATASAAPIYGANAALKYNTTGSLTVGPEWVTPFIAKKGIQIANKGVITIGNNIEKRFDDGIPLIIDDGASLKVGKDSNMYFGGDFKNNQGSLITDGYIYLTGQKNQQIGSFTSSVGVVMNKTAGVATFITNITTKELKIDGQGGTLNLGAGLTHTFTDWVRTQGTLNGNSSLLKFSGNVTGTGGDFIAETGTVEFGGSDQNLGTGSITYNNLVLSGTRTKTFGAKTTINDTFSIASGVVANLTANLVHTAKYIKLGGAAGSGGSWGSNKSNAVNKNDTYFVLNNGIVNVGPTIVISTNSLSALTTTYGTASSSNNFDITGIAMLEGIVVTAPSGFEVSTDGTTFSDKVTIGAAGGIALTKVYVRLKATAPAGSYSSGNVVLSSNGTTTVNIPIATSTVNKAELTIKADNLEKFYGSDNPVLTAAYSGFVNAETVEILTKLPTITTTAVKGSAVGTYLITATGAEALNYKFKYEPVNGTLTVKPVALKITTNDNTKVYGSVNPVLIVSYDGFVNGDTEANLATKPTITTKAVTGSAVGSYPVTATGAASSNYTITYNNKGSLTITPAKLTIKGDNKTREHGVENPILTASYDGFVNGDTAASLTTPVTIATVAVKDSSVGKYDITVSGATSSNYDITFVSGTLEVTKSTNAGLTDLAISEGTLSPVFVEGTKDYTAIVPNDVKTIKVTPTTADTEAKVTVNGVDVPSGTPSGEIPLQVGKNEITTVITAQDGTTNTYTVIVTREPSTDAGLADITVSEGTLSPAFDTDTKGYSVDVPNATDSIVITPTPRDPDAKVEMKIGDITIDPTAPIDLKVGDNEVTVVVTAPDGTTQETYTIIVTREPSTDAGLADITVSEGTLSPAFDTDTKGYSVDVPNTTDSIVITPTPKDPDAKVEMIIDGKTITDNTAPIDLKVGDNEVTVVVTAPDGTTQETYIIIVTREPSTDAGLSNLTVSEGTLSPAFDVDTKGYTVDVANATDSIVITPTPKDPDAKVEMIIDGKTITDNTAPIDLKVGDNVVTVVVTAPDGTTQETYTVIVTREPSSDAGLADLTVSEGTLSPAFDTDTKGYSVDVPNTTDSIVITPTPRDPDAKVEMKIGDVTIDPTAPIDLKVGENVVTVVVTAPDGTQEIYSVVVTRDEPTNKPSDNAGLADITVSDGTLSPAFNTDTNDYRVDVPNETDSIVITPKTIDQDATVEMTIDGKIITDPTSPIDLNVGENVITIVVTAPDGTQDTYVVIVDRADATPQAIVPTNIITPNGDGKNDNWVIPGIDKYPNNSVKVFDRAARLVYAKNNYNNEWDGTFKGSPLNEDTYYYLIDLGNGTPKIKGFISIIRDNN